ncbi:MAG: VOC family protein [Opitutaceae bacterium]
MSEKKESLLGTRKVSQIAIVVRDIEKTSRAWAEVLGLDVPKWFATQPGSEVGMTFRGEPSDARAKLAFFHLDNITIELIEPMGGKSSWQEALDNNGESVHHIAFNVSDTEGRVKALATRGIEKFHQGGDPKTGQYTYVDASKQLGLVIEMLEGY